MKLIKKLQECSTLGQADPILTRLGAGPAVKKLVETAMILGNSQDPQQRSHAYAFMETAIKELQEQDHDVDKSFHDQHKTSEEEHSEDDELDNKKLSEEVLDNHNNGPREDGSEQSTENEEPDSGQGKDTTKGEKAMQDMDGTENQWNETGGMIPGMPQMPPQQMMGGMPPGMPGLEPGIAQELGGQMAPPPPMDTNQMMRQMQYTVDSKMKEYHNRFVAPLNTVLKQQRETIKNQKNAIKELSMQIREISSNSGTIKLDLDSLKQNAQARFRETEIPAPLGTFTPSNRPVRIQNKKDQTREARAEIEQMDKIMRSENNPMYN